MSNAAPGGETMTPEQEVDELLREFQRACEAAAAFDPPSPEAAKHRAILRNDLRARLLSGCFDVRCIGCGQIGTWRADPDAASLSSTPTRAATDAGIQRFKMVYGDLEPRSDGPWVKWDDVALAVADYHAPKDDVPPHFGDVEGALDDIAKYLCTDLSHCATHEAEIRALQDIFADRDATIERLASSSSPSSTTATPDTLHPADEAMLQSYATRQIGEGMPGMVQDASKLARYAIILRMQLSAASALPSSRALSETEHADLGAAAAMLEDYERQNDGNSAYALREGYGDNALLGNEEAEIHMHRLYRDTASEAHRLRVALLILRDRLTGAPK